MSSKYVWIVSAMSFILVGSAIANDGSLKRVNGLDIPVTKEATNVTDSGFTANWEPAAKADWYGAYAVLTHRAKKDSVYYLVDEDFHRITSGTFEDPKVGDSDFEYLDQYMSRTDWFACMPEYIVGILGLDNFFSPYTPAALLSPIYDLSHDGGTVTVTLTFKGAGIDTVIVSLCDVNDDVIDMKRSPVTSEWTTVAFELQGGLEESYIGITMEGMGELYIDDLKVSQNLKAGESISLLYAYGTTADTSYDFLTPDKSDGDSYSFKVAAFVNDSGEIIQSDFSELRPVVSPVDMVSTPAIDDTKVFVKEDLHVVLPDPSLIKVYSSNGVCIASQMGEAGDNRIKLPSAGMYLVRVGDEIFKVIK